MVVAGTTDDAKYDDHLVQLSVELQHFSILTVKPNSLSIGKKSKVSHSQLGAWHNCKNDDDFVWPPLTFLARLQEVPV
nr:uncharacterized protein LOC109182831 [Ipomoea batatas]